jgi:thiol-disulfide isomerase/thioredoxin
MSPRPSLHAKVALGLAVLAGAAWIVARDDGATDDPFVQVIDDTDSDDTVATTDATDATDATGPTEGSEVRLPELTLVDLAGRTVTTSSLTGTPLVVNFWFVSCPPCRGEMPEFAEVARRLDGQVRFVGVDPFDDGDEMQAFVDELGVGYEQLRDVDGTLTGELGITSFPTTLFVRADGVVTAGYVGALDADGLERMLRDELGVG